MMSTKITNTILDSLEILHKFISFILKTCIFACVHTLMTTYEFGRIFTQSSQVPDGFASLIFCNLSFSTSQALYKNTQSIKIFFILAHVLINI